MKNRNNQLTATLFVIALAVAPFASAKPYPDGGPIHAIANDAPQPGGIPTKVPANDAPRPDGGPVAATAQINDQGEQMPVISIHSAGDVSRGKTGSFVLSMSPVMLGGAYVNFSVSGTAIKGVDYLSLISPAYITQSGYGVILVQTLADPRAFSRQSYSVVVTLEPGVGYAVGQPNSAQLMINP